MTLRKALNLTLTAVLLISITIVGGVTLATHGKDLAYGALVTYAQLLPKEPGDFGGAFDSLTARINAVSRAANVNLYQKGFFEKLNARLQLSVGKQMLSFGGSMMVTTKTGHLYDLVDYVDTTKDVEKLSELNQRLKAKGIPLLYGYAHTTLYQDGMLPDGVSDDNNRVADELVKGLRAAGIPTLDSRELMQASGRPLSDMIYRTDAHWSVYSAFEMYARMVDLLNEKTTIKADKNAANIANFDITMLEQAHISDIGRRLGADLIRPDDFQILTPKFETDIRKEIMKDKQLVPTDGRFEDVVCYPDQLPEALGVSVANCYNYYGPHPDVVYYHNDGAPEGRLLIVKDSFGTPTSSLMSLAVRDICAIDLRKNPKKTIEDYVESFKPDAVVVVQCQEVFHGQNYMFINN